MSYYKTEALSLSPLLLLMMDESPGATTAVDSSTDGYNGAISASGVDVLGLDSSHWNGTYSTYYFEGMTGAYVAMGSTMSNINGHFSGAGAGSYSCPVFTFWVQSNAVDVGGGSVLYLNGFHVNIASNGNITIDINGSHPATFAVNLLDGNEHFVSATYTVAFIGNYNVNLYANVTIDGVLYQQVSSGEQDVMLDSMSVYNQSSYIGSDKNGATNFKGNLSRVAVFPSGTDTKPLWTIGSSPYANAPAVIIPNPIRESALPAVGSPVVLADGILDLSFGNQRPPAIIANPLNTHPDEIIWLPRIVEFMRLDYQQWLIANGYCPPAPTPITVLSGGTQDGLPAQALAAGFYYRIPTDTGTVQGQPIPKYFNQLTFPFSAYVYPNGNQYYGMMLVKTLTAMNPVPNDVTVLTETEVLSELQTDVDLLFAM